MSQYLWTSAPMVRAHGGEVVVLVASTPTLTPEAAREMSQELLNAAKEAERQRRR